MLVVRILYLYVDTVYSCGYNTIDDEVGIKEAVLMTATGNRVGINTEQQRKLVTTAKE